jgi:hypothetical protein
LLRKARGEGVKKKHGNHATQHGIAITDTHGDFFLGWLLGPNLFLKTLDGIC